VRSYDTPKRQLETVWAATPTEVWAAGDTGTVVHWNGSTFTPMLLPQSGGTQYALWGTSASDVWCVGSPASITHRWNGSAWVPITSLGSYGSYGVVAYAPDNALAISAASSVLAWNGSAWSVQLLDTNTNYYAIHGCNADEAWISTDDGRIFHYVPDGGALALEYTDPSASSIDALFCHPTEGVWAVGSGGKVIRRQAGAWTPYSIGAVTNALTSVWVSADGTAWIAGDSRTLLRISDGGVIVPFNVPPYNVGSYTDLFGIGNDLWITGRYSQVGGFDGGVMLQYRVGN
jgi:hypothetical protein